MPQTDGGPEKRVLLFCTDNTCRPQMVEAVLQHQAPGRFKTTCAGSRNLIAHPLAMRVLSESGITLAASKSPSLDELDPSQFDLLINLGPEDPDYAAFCGHASCVRLEFHAPPKGCNITAEMTQEFRAVRDSILETLGKRLQDFL